MTSDTRRVLNLIASLFCGVCVGFACKYEGLSNGSSFTFGFVAYCVLDGLAAIAHMLERR